MADGSNPESEAIRKSRRPNQKKSFPFSWKGLFYFINFSFTEQCCFISIDNMSLKSKFRFHRIHKDKYRGFR
ncbi:MAG: hypothetical protein IIW81_00835, partial [Oscillospiraceae bacterium]|nr:hypothetical protein [Oscillospiraceae bacterium]